MPLAVVVVATLGLLACSGARDTEPPPAVAAEPELEVHTALVRRGSILASISAPATLEALRESFIGPEVQGTLLRVLVDEGERVEAGAPLFEIDPSPYRFALRQAEAGLDLAKAQRRQLEADLGRARSLRQRGIVAEQDIEKLETAVAVAAASERQAAETVALARHRLALTRVHAPYAASVAARLADEGTTALVQPQTVVLVLQESSFDEEQLRQCLKQALCDALGALVLMRDREGEATRIDISERLAQMAQLLEQIEARAPRVPIEWQQKLQERLARYGEEGADPQRIAQEIALFADRCDISEEVVRFKSHLEQFADLLDAGEPVGRQMDFLIQELNRETNTMGSKSNDAVLTRQVVTIKAELEKIREQVQNIE